MKQIIAVFMLGLLCAGCASDTGIHMLKLNYNSIKIDKETNELTPSFRVAAEKPEIADQGRGALLGKWRTVFNMTSVVDTEKIELHFAMGVWEIKIYEFSEDGTYSMRRLAKDKKTILKSIYGEDGQWTYADGVLRLQANGCNGNVRCRSELRVKWHSVSSFTLEYANLDAVKAARDNDDKEKHYQTYLNSYHYDDRGCLQQSHTHYKDDIFGAWHEMYVFSPWLFVKID